MAFRHSILAVTALGCAALFQATAAMAHGAIAVGQPSSVAESGVAVGYTWNYDSAGEAEADALKQCLSYMDAPDSTRARNLSAEDRAEYDAAIDGYRAQDRSYRSRDAGLESSRS